MATIPFTATQASGMEALGGASPLSANIMVDGTGTIRARPTIATWSDFPSSGASGSSVVGMVPWGDYLVYVTANRKLHYWLAGAVNDISTSTATTQLDGAARPVMLPLRTKVVVAGGGAPQTWAGTGNASRLGGSPPNCTHLAGIATRIVANVADQSGTFQWSNLGDSGHTTWDALNYAEAEARPDSLPAIYESTNEVFAFGKETLQVYVPDAVVGFASLRALGVGLLAPYSPVRVDDAFAFLDRESRFVLTDGRTFNEESIISSGIEKSLRALTRLDACWGFRMKLDQWDAAVWMFPTDGKGFIYDLRQRRWSEWRQFGTNGWTASTITSAVAWPEKRLLLVGLSDGSIAKLDPAGSGDLTNPVRIELVTGFVNRETDAYKHASAVRLRFRRGQSSSGGTAQVALSWRDDMGPYCRPVIKTLGALGDSEPTITIRPAGRPYRQRQWRLEYTGSVEFVFAGAEEEVQVLEAA